LKRTNLIALAIAALVALALFALVPSREEAKGPLVLAASSLQESLEAAANAWAEMGHTRPVLSFAGTPALARQVEAGAPADIFISADEQWMDELARKGLVQARTRATFLGNRLVLVEQAEKNTQLALEPGDALAFALRPQRIALADPDAVPAGRYARQALTKLGVWQDVEPSIIVTENVRAAAALVSQGEAPLGIVYETDARAEPKLRVVARFPKSSHVPVTYPLALLESSAHPDAQTFRQFLLSDEAGAIFERFGFSTQMKR
jgi:molybdate transport system substrate-binding protein